ncbi:glycine cleavage system protein GcvH [Longispora fulva]|uniref:glycine cleavage system protein GcvH n=1 Tax=Longispora fulva TaxID=619741 RepID=UPI0018CB9F23
MNVPEDLLYSAEHEWVRQGDILIVGVTAHAADALGDIVYVELPQAGDVVVAGDPCGELESTKAVSDLYSPVSGTVTAVNTRLKATPAIINDDPYGEGWIFQVVPSGDYAPEALMDSDAYARLVKDS